MVSVSNADRIVFPEVGKTKGDVVTYYERIAARALPHLLGRPLSLRRYPKGLAAPGFFQKNVPAHYPESIARYGVPRSKEATKKHRDPDARAKDVTMFRTSTSRIAWSSISIRRRPKRVSPLTTTATPAQARYSVR